MPVTLFDSHCHLDRVDLTPFDGDFDRFMQEAASAGIEDMLCVSIDPAIWPDMAALVADYVPDENGVGRSERPRVRLSYGMHPNDEPGVTVTVEDLVAGAAKPGVVAIGETGLDYFRSGQAEDWQHERFHAHIEAAKQVGKPVIIHTRSAAEDTMRVLEETGAEQCGGVMHCFVENWEIAKRALDIGFYISFSGILTYKSAAELREVARKLPQDRILVETDSPYLAPVPHRGKSNTPIWVRHVAETLADVRGEPLAQVAEYTRENTRRFLGIAS